jgi:hypothetical protein
MAATHGDIAVVTANLYLRSFLDGPAIRSDTEIHDGFPSAMANRFEFDQIVRQCKQRCAPGKKLRLEIRPQAIT